MNEKDKLGSLREEIDAADASLIRSFLERMDVSARIAELKRGAGMPTRDPDREREKLRAVTADVDPDMRPYAEVLYSLLFELSTSYQEKLNARPSPLCDEIASALESTPQLPEKFRRCACLSDDAAAREAAEKLLPMPEIMGFSEEGHLLRAVTEGLCSCAVLRIGDGTDTLTALSDGSLRVVRSFEGDGGRYVCAEKETRIYPGADRTLLELTLPHKAGALYKVTSRLYLLGINVLDLRSTPAAGGKVRFFFELEASVYSDGLTCLARELGDVCDGYRYIGTYTHTV